MPILATCGDRNGGVRADPYVTRAGELEPGRKASLRVPPGVKTAMRDAAAASGGRPAASGGLGESDRE